MYGNSSLDDSYSSLFSSTLENECVCNEAIELFPGNQLDVEQFPAVSFPSLESIKSFPQTCLNDDDLPSYKSMGFAPRAPLQKNNEESMSTQSMHTNKHDSFQAINSNNVQTVSEEHPYFKQNNTIFQSGTNEHILGSSDMCSNSDQHSLSHIETLSESQNSFQLNGSNNLAQHSNDNVKNKFFSCSNTNLPSMVDKEIISENINNSDARSQQVSLSINNENNGDIDDDNIGNGDIDDGSIGNGDVDDGKDYATDLDRPTQSHASEAIQVLQGTCQDQVNIRSAKPTSPKFENPTGPGSCGFSFQEKALVQNRDMKSNFQNCLQVQSLQPCLPRNSPIIQQAFFQRKVAQCNHNYSDCFLIHPTMGTVARRLDLLPIERVKSNVDARHDEIASTTEALACLGLKVHSHRMQVRSLAQNMCKKLMNLWAYF